MTDLGLNGAILQMISHGLIGAALFFLAGISYDRTRTLFLDQMGGTAIYMPKIFTMFSSFSLASLALPGMSGFLAEFLVFLGIIISNKYSFNFKIVVTIIEAIGIILTPIYLLSMLRQMFYGYKVSKFFIFSNIDAGPRELFILICLIFPVIGIGIYPNSVLYLWNSKVNFLLSKFLF
jgi:NAD(P)H-quinone oxidoreductase subunit 4